MSTPAPLAGLKVLEFDAIGLVPFCGMMLADHDAQITRPHGQPNGIDAGEEDMLLRGRAEQIPLDLKSKEGRVKILNLVADFDVLLEGHRPGVMERLGIGPEECHAVNPKLVYCRITGYGQTGPLAINPGHDINYIAHTGALHAIGAADQPPPPPLSLIGDFGGRGLLGAFGVLAAVISAHTTGKGSVVDAAMVMEPLCKWL
ncbi:CoA transferase [Ruegeria lacuscaerulensis]|uniref:CoA transferase n=1 Tax=Ruegeria lacuscaerulensis TaxID=55218 RepID=UPI00147A0A42|nr:CaiB/BaiF CoA-transferase family protein [Ruegeria lacuscaerulensis]